MNINWPRLAIIITLSVLVINGCAANIKAPFVFSPIDGATEVPVNTTISVAFSEPMNKADTEKAFSISPSVAGSTTWTDENKKLNFKPSSNLDYSKRYTVRVTGKENGAKAESGAGLENTLSFSFTTEKLQEPTLRDNLPPRARFLDDITPDLSNAKLVITEEGLQRMAEEGVPPNVIDQLRSLVGQEFNNAGRFIAAVRERTGSQVMREHGSAIYRNSMQVSLAQEAPFPGTEMQEAGRQSENLMGSAIFKPVFFEFDKSDITPAFMESIRKNADALNGNADMKVDIEGHCDERGTTEYNLALGQRRATAVMNALLELGVNKDQMKTISYGEERKVIVKARTEAEHAKNRRTVITILK